jgi:holo-[acyl-carrier protein] synthase
MHSVAVASSMLPTWNESHGHLRAGIDIVRISDIAHSMAQFGARFENRLFSGDEIAYARSADDETVTATRLAARFAAKEAAIKAFALSEIGVNWRDLEIVRFADGMCKLELRGRAADAVGAIEQCVVTLSHQGDYATAMIVAIVAHDTRGSV